MAWWLSWAKNIKRPKKREKITYISEAQDATVSSPRLSPAAPTAAVAAITDWLLLLPPPPFRCVEVTWDVLGLLCGYFGGHWTCHKA
jgi:hypothetical protein